jgi:hypothetical protein
VQLESIVGCKKNYPKQKRKAKVSAQQGGLRTNKKQLIAALINPTVLV